MPRREEAYALFLDFDGTLVDIAERPDAIIVPPDLKKTLAKLKERFNGALAIISGRSLDTLDHYLSPLNIDLAGLHGLELRIAGKMLVSQPPPKSVGYQEVLETLKAQLAALPGTLVEDKQFSIGLHWREAPQYKEKILRLAEKALRKLGKDYRLQHGKCVVEIVPKAASKASALEKLMAMSAYENRQPVFIGDDVTDEDGFKFVNDLGGLSVIIGARKTTAQYALPSPDKLLLLLSAWSKGAPIQPETQFKALGR